MPINPTSDRCVEHCCPCNRSKPVIRRERVQQHGLEQHEALPQDEREEHLHESDELSDTRCWSSDPYVPELMLGIVDHLCTIRRTPQRCRRVLTGEFRRY